jgi:hypothetical protein
MHTHEMIELHHEFEDGFIIDAAEFEHQPASSLTTHKKSIATTVASDSEATATQRTGRVS